MKNILVLFCVEAEFHLSGYVNNRYSSTWNPVLIPGMQYIIVCGIGQVVSNVSKDCGASTSESGGLICLTSSWCGH
jgi:hypothetical protein